MPDNDSRVGDFPKAGVQLHLQFGKLYLGHHVFRGLSSSSPIPQHFLSAANMACSAARSVFSMILHNVSLRASLVGRPHYVFIMTSFAGHFLLEVCDKYSDQISSPGIDVSETIQLIQDVLAVLHDARVVAQHPLRRMILGLRRKLAIYTARLQNGSSTTYTGDVQGANLGGHLTRGMATAMVDNGTAGGSHARTTSAQMPGIDFAAMGQMSGQLEQDLYVDYDVFDNFPDIYMSALE